MNINEKNNKMKHIAHILYPHFFLENFTMFFSRGGEFYYDLYHNIATLMTVVLSNHKMMMMCNGKCILE